MAFCSVVVLDMSVFEDPVIELGHKRTTILNNGYLNTSAQAGDGVIQVEASACLIYVCNRQEIPTAHRDQSSQQHG